jgi:hypothetical protein
MALNGKFIGKISMVRFGLKRVGKILLKITL